MSKHKFVLSLISTGDVHTNDIVGVDIYLFETNDNFLEVATFVT